MLYSTYDFREKENLPKKKTINLEIIFSKINTRDLKSGSYRETIVLHLSNIKKLYFDITYF